jgi:hypothetical protein
VESYTAQRNIVAAPAGCKRRVPPFITHATVARVTPVWQAWFQKRFPKPAELGQSE